MFSSHLKISRSVITLGEGIPLHQYNLFSLLSAIPVALLLETFFWLQRMVTHDKGITTNNDLPPNAIIVTFHGDSYLDPLSVKAWNYLSNSRYHWLGFHGFLSYIGSMRAMFYRIKAFRYKTKSKIRPMDQVREFLNNYQSGQLMLRTDAGGPYGKVRPSLIKLAIESKRPLVCMRTSASRFITINHHKLGTPGSVIETKISCPIEYEKLEKLAKTDIFEACMFVENEMLKTLNL